MEALEARNSQLQVALEEGRGSPHRAASTFYNNSDDIARLLDQVAELRSTSREQKQRIALLTRENDQLRAGFRLARAVGSPSRHPSRNPAGRRFDDRDVVISRLEAQVLSLEDALKVYRDAAADRERRRQVRRRHEAEERRELAGPVDLTVAWRPKKNVISERTEMLAARAGRRRRAQAAERKAIELEQRDIILSRYAKTKRQNPSASSGRGDYRIRKEIRADARGQRREMARRMKKEEGKWTSSRLLGAVRNDEVKRSSYSICTLRLTFRVFGISFAAC